MYVFSTPSKLQDMRYVRISRLICLEAFLSKRSVISLYTCRYRAGVRVHRVHRGTQPLDRKSSYRSMQYEVNKEKSRASPARLTWLLQPEYSAYISSASITQLPAQCLFGLDLVVHIHTVPSAHLFRSGRSPFIWSGTTF